MAVQDVTQIRTHGTNYIDFWLVVADTALRTLFAPARSQREPDGLVDNLQPLEAISAAPLSKDQKKQVAALMRVNHAGEICAQALYTGQALATKNAQLREHLAQAGKEELDHLAWTERRLMQLGEKTSVLNPFWYAGAFAIGYGAARYGDGWSLGFVAETEWQVEQHLQGHMDILPLNDWQSLAILQQMKKEESTHRRCAMDAGARNLPTPIKRLMRVTAKVMTTLAARL